MIAILHAKQTARPPHLIRIGVAAACREPIKLRRSVILGLAEAAAVTDLFLLSEKQMARISQYFLFAGLAREEPARSG